MISALKRFLQSLGPGFIIASAVLGPGSIAIASRIGSEHGYDLVWIVVVATVCMITYASIGTRFGILNDISMLQAIADTYGRWFSILIGISSFLSCASFQFGNNLGIATGMQSLTGISHTVWPFIFTPLAMILIFWAKNIYQILEKLMMAMVLIMIIAFISNLIFVKPDMLAVFKGFLPSAFAKDQLDDIAAVVATTFALVGCVYQSYVVHDKGWTIHDLRTGTRDTVMGIGVLGTISILIMVTAGAAVHPKGITVATAGDMAMQLEALFGKFAKYIFSIGLCAAAFSSLVVNSVIGGGLLSDGLGKGRSMHEKMPRILSCFILLLGMIVAVFFRGNIVYALVLASASSIFAIPAVAVGLFLVANNKKIMKHLCNNRKQNVVAGFGFILILTMVFYLYYRIVAIIGNLS